MRTFVTRSREDFEEEFHDQERLDYERSDALTREFMRAIRIEIGCVWFRLKSEQKTDHPTPFNEIRHALGQVEDEICHWAGIEDNISETRARCKSL